MEGNFLYFKKFKEDYGILKKLGDTYDIFSNSNLLFGENILAIPSYFLG